jgi:hypothetical protein
MDAFKKKWHKHWERCIHTEGNYVEGDGGPKLVYDQMAAPVSELMDTLTGPGLITTG